MSEAGNDCAESPPRTKSPQPQPQLQVVSCWWFADFCSTTAETEGRVAASRIEEAAVAGRPLGGRRGTVEGVVVGSGVRAREPAGGIELEPIGAATRDRLWGRALGLWRCAIQGLLHIYHRNWFSLLKYVIHIYHLLMTTLTFRPYLYICQPKLTDIVVLTQHGQAKWRHCP
jgi:hypothetical protein